MGIDRNFDAACYKALISAGLKLPASGGVYITVNDEDKPKILSIARELQEMGFRIFATKGTSTYLREQRLHTTTVYTISQNMDPDALGLMRNGDINLIINTPSEASGARRDGFMMRRLAVELEIPFLTTVQAAHAAVAAMKRSRLGPLDVVDIGSYQKSC